MDVLLWIITLGALIISAASFSVIRYVAHRPANGELKTLARIEAKIHDNQKLILASLHNCHII